MNSRKKRHKIFFQENTQAPGNSGGLVDNWADTVSDWASIWPVSAGERIENAKTEHQVSHRIRIRYRTGLTPSMRIRFGARVFDIKSMTNIDELSRELEFIAREVD